MIKENIEKEFKEFVKVHFGKKLKVEIWKGHIGYLKGKVLDLVKEIDKRLESNERRLQRLESCLPAFPSSNKEKNLKYYK